MYDDFKGEQICPNNNLNYKIIHSVYYSNFKGNYKLYFLKMKFSYNGKINSLFISYRSNEFYIKFKDLLINEETDNNILYKLSKAFNNSSKFKEFLDIFNSYMVFS